MQTPYVVIPRDSCDARMNKIRKKLTHCLNRMIAARESGNRHKYCFYAELVMHHKQELERVHELKEMGFNDIFERNASKRY